MKEKVKIADLMAMPPAVVQAAQPMRPEPVVTSKARSHTTIYLPRAALREIRTIALQFDVKPHDLLIEGVNLMLAKYGRPPLDPTSKQ